MRNQNCDNIWKNENSYHYYKQYHENNGNVFGITKNYRPRLGFKNFCQVYCEIFIVKLKTLYCRFILAPIAKRKLEKRRKLLHIAKK